MATSAGYSGTPLARKLGLRPGLRVCLLQEPPGFRDRVRRRQGVCR